MDASFLATDAEVEEIDKLAKSRGVLHWPALIRTINRLREAERALAELRAKATRATI